MQAQQAIKTQTQMAELYTELNEDKTSTPSQVKSGLRRPESNPDLKNQLPADVVFHHYSKLFSHCFIQGLLQILTTQHIAIYTF
jgi:hypothetical protein